MDLVIYLVVILVGILMMILARTQKKKDGQYSRRSIIILNIGAAIVTFSLLQKLPDFIAVIIKLWHHN